MFNLFVNPALLWLAGLISVPILIYLFNRQRYRRRKWAAMEFLLRALKKNQRRLQLQNLLLLLIRTLIILLLVFAVARPILRSNPLLSSGDGQQNWIFVMDTSYSMGYRSNSVALFDEARETMSGIVENLLQPGDTVALMSLAHDPEVLIGRTQMTPDFKARFARELEDLKLTARSARIMPSLRVLESLADEFVDQTGQAEPVRVVLFSDLQRKDWLLEDAPRSPEMSDLLAALKERGAVISIEQIDSEERVNVAIRDLSIKPELVARDVPVSINVSVENMSKGDADNLDLTIRVIEGELFDPEALEDQNSQLGEVLRIPGGETVSRALPYRFDTAGFFTIVAEVRSDGLVIDNTRSLVVEVQEDIGVLLIDGDPSVEETERETFFLELALRPRDISGGALGARYTPFLPEYVTTDQLEEVDWSKYSAVIMTNVDELPKPVVPQLERFVADGGALIVYLGDNVRPDVYNETLYKDGTGLLPVELGARRGDRRTPVYLRFVAPNHPVAAYFEAHPEMTYLTGPVVSFYEYFEVLEPEDENAPRNYEVLCRYEDLKRNAAIFDASFGQGRTMWITSSANREWNEFAVWQDYVVFLYESMSYLLGFRGKSLNLEVGQTFERFYGSESFASEVLLHVPSMGRNALESSRVVRRSMRESGERRFTLDYAETAAPGLYRLDLKRPNTDVEDSVEIFSVNVDSSEGDLTPMTRDDFSEHFGIEPDGFDASERFRDLAAQQELLRGQEYWRGILIAVVLLLLLETALAQIFGRRAR